MRKKNKRDDHLLKLAEAIAQLTDKVVADTPYFVDGVGRAVRAEERTHKVVAPPLLRQLVRSLQPGAATGEQMFRSKPKPRTPSAGHISDTLTLISQEVSKLRADMRAEAEHPPTPHGPRTVQRELLEIRSMAFVASDARLAEAARLAQRWVGKARVALTWDAPVVTLTEASCPYCGGELQVAKDASSDVWCAGTPAGRDTERQPPCRGEDGERRSWPQETWLLLLERLNAGERVGVS